MALRIRITGEILCAAHTKAEKGDTYIDDQTHYMLSQLTRAIVPSENHEKDNLWFWNVQPDMIEHYKKIIKYNNSKKIKG